MSLPGTPPALPSGTAHSSLCPPGFAAGEHDPAAVERGRVLFAGACDFILGAARLEQIPESDLPEIAFAGRSNVGKSSLMNAILGRKALARTSNTPGRTREINFFMLGDRMTMADLPGYGYARAPRTRVKEWTQMVRGYLKGRQTLRRVCLLVDARHGVMKNDRDIMSLLDSAAVVYQAVLTKCDKVSSGQVEAIRRQIEDSQKIHAALFPRVFATSSRKGTGLQQLRAELATLVPGGDPVITA